MWGTGLLNTFQKFIAAVSSAFQIFSSPSRCTVCMAWDIKHEKYAA